MPVLREVAVVRAACDGKRGGEAPVQAAPLARQQLAVDHLADQLMPEGIAVAGRHQQPRFDGSLRRGQQPPFRKLDGGGHQLM
jgi:hypothetical protein